MGACVQEKQEKGRLLSGDRMACACCVSGVRREVGCAPPKKALEQHMCVCSAGRAWIFARQVRMSEWRLTRRRPAAGDQLS